MYLDVHIGLDGDIPDHPRAISGIVDDSEGTWYEVTMLLLLANIQSGVTQGIPQTVDVLCQTL